MAVTLKQIAEHTGLSRQAVGFILHNQGSFKQDTRDRVIRAARELGYRPNYAAQALLQNCFNAIALLQGTQSFRSLVQGDLIVSISEAAERHGRHLSIATVRDEVFEDLDLVPKALRELMVDGLLINLNMDIPLAMLDLIARNRIPTVWLNVKRETDAVHPDDVRASRDLVRAMMRKGHRRVMYVDSAYDTTFIHYSRKDRYDGYRLAMKDAGVKPPAKAYLGDGGARDEAFLAYVDDALSSRRRPDGIIAYSGDDIETIYHRAITRHGLRVPADLLLGSYAHVRTWPGLPIVHCAWPGVALGAAAVEMLLKKIDRPATALRSRAVRFDLVDNTDGKGPR